MRALDFGAQEFVDLENAVLEDVSKIDLVFDVIDGDIGKRSPGAIRAGGTLVTIAAPSEARPMDGLAIDWSSCPIAPNWVRSSGGCGTDDNAATLDDAVAAFNPTERITGKTIISVRP